MRKHGLAGYFNLQTYNTGESCRQCTPKDNRCQVYLGLVHGMRMFTWFMNRPQSDALWDSFVGLKREMEALTELLGDASAVELDYGENSGVHFSLWQTRGKYCLLLANPSEVPATLSYPVPVNGENAPKAARALFPGDPTPSLSAGRVEVNLGWYGCGAYLLE